METVTKFSQLLTGQAFDFVGPIQQYNSFFLRCIKISMRKYLDSQEILHKVGYIHCEVFHVEIL